MTSASVDPQDLQYEEATIVELRAEKGGHTIKRDDGWSFFLDHGPVVPKVGMRVRFYGRGLGYVVRGVVVDGHTFFYRTAEEEEERHKQWVADLKRERAKEYERTKDELSMRLAAYPDVFRRRIERFLANSPTAWEHQGYEMAVCDAALFIIEKYPELEGFNAWSDNDFKPTPPESHELGLSGNQWDMAKRLAYWWHTDRDNVWKDHAAIAALIGCEEAGCIPLEDDHRETPK